LKALILQAQQLGIALPPGILSFVSGPVPATGSAVFTRNLKIGMKGDDVAALQTFLIQQNSGSFAQQLGAAGSKGYFGSLTKQALKEFQKASGITPAAGFFGPATRAYVQAMMK
jgi:peptidoglycan hydrolase-like protein with peptidoglycan-binding domain